MTPDDDQPARSFRSHFLAECRRRWWHALLAIGGTAGCVAMLGPLGLAVFAFLAAIGISSIAAGLVGASTFPRKKGAVAEWVAESTRKDRERWSSAAQVVSVAVWAGVAIVAHDLAAPPDERVVPPGKALYCRWASDREIVWISQGRHLVFYNVVDRKRTRIVTLK